VDKVQQPLEAKKFGNEELFSTTGDGTHLQWSESSVVYRKMCAADAKINKHYAVKLTTAHFRKKTMKNVSEKTHEARAIYVLRST
jgi:hypothetical protein